MLAWSKAPWWEGLSRPTGGSHSAKHTAVHCGEKHTGKKWERAHWQAHPGWLKGVHFAVVHSRGGIGWSEMASCKKPAFIPHHYQTKPLSINLSKLSFTTNYRCQLEGFVLILPGWKPGIFFVFGKFNQRLFLVGFCDIHQKFLIENDISRGKCSDSHEVNGLVHLKWNDFIKKPIMVLCGSL